MTCSAERVFKLCAVKTTVQRWKSCLRVTASTSVELLSHIVSMKDQLAEYHSHNTGLEGLIFLRSVELWKVEEHSVFSGQQCTVINCLW